jgi:uncharacterized protein
MKNQVKNNARLRITESLLMLERGRDELLLADLVDLRPLYIKKGRRYIANFLKAASELASYESIINALPHEKDLLDTLLGHGIIVPGVASKHNSRPGGSSGELCPDEKRSISLFLLISQSCNMGCVYCLNGTKTYQTGQDLRMSKGVAFRSVERCLDDIGPGGSLEVIFFGGEPLLNWPLAKEIITHCEDHLKAKHPGKRITYHLTSNLSFIPNDLIAWATKRDITFLCDVDGPETIHNRSRPFKDGRPSHGTITGNIKRLVAAGLKVDLRATITAFNQDHLLEITEHHKEIGGASSAFVPVNPVNSDEDILAARLLPSPRKIIKGLTEVYRSGLWKEEELYPFNQYAPRLMPGAGTSFGCGAPCGNTVVVDVTGNAYPCIYLVGIRRFFMGNIMNKTYPNRALLRWMRDYLNVDQMEDCKSCPWRYICGGGCPLRRLTALNNALIDDRLTTYEKRIHCDCTKKIIELVLWDKAERAASNLLEHHTMRERLTIAPDTARAVRC